MEIKDGKIVKEPLVAPDLTLADVNKDVCNPLETFPTKKWYVCLVLSLSALLVGGVMVWGLIGKGIGVTGLNQPVGWGAFDITNFVFWIGIGHAGTLISAILYLFRQKWRTAINRSAEAMTIFAVMTAGLFPLLHVGRQWYAFWLLPYPNQRELWVNFRSPLLWDVFAVSTYFTISLLFWYTGLVPDLASVRDRCKNRIRKFVYTILSLGWRGQARQWNHYEMVYLLLAALSTPLVLSVHSIVSFDFAVSILPGWHTTIFPPYFVAGAIFSGFAMVVTLLVIAREVFKLKKYITLYHLENMNKIMLLTGMMVGYAYLMELFIAWYSGNLYERFIFLNRVSGPFAWAYWIMMSCNVLTPQIFWVKKWRRSVPVMFVASLLVNIGMWFERFTIIVTSLNNDFLPSSWDSYYPTRYDWGITLGAFGFFFTFFLLFCRFMPTIAMFEVKSIMKIGRKEARAEMYAGVVARTD
ncbi:MAG: polysulfide reductase NrfD [Deltaproteobacteria bacterium]|nr:polysulfide reductase NrfD [Deltaproteobacteria bacterium]